MVVFRLQPVIRNPLDRQDEIIRRRLDAVFEAPDGSEPVSPIELGDSGGCENRFSSDSRNSCSIRLNDAGPDLIGDVLIERAGTSSQPARNHQEDAVRPTENEVRDYSLVRHDRIRISRIQL